MDATANHYGGPQDGAIDPFNPSVLLGGCSYGDLDPTEHPFYNVASFAPGSSLVRGLDQFGCGSCFEIRCVDRAERCLGPRDGRSIVVVNGGTCGLGCGDTQVNLHVFAFDKLAPIRLGNVKIQLRQVECEPIGNLVVVVKNYRIANGGYIKLLVRNVPSTGALAEVHLRSAGEGNQWTELRNLFGASWEGSDLSRPPFDIRLRESLGAEVILEKIIREAGYEGEIDSRKQFPGFSKFSRTQRRNFVDNAASMDRSQSPNTIRANDPVSQTPAPFRVGASPSPTLPDRPEVDPDDLNTTISFADGK